MAGKFSALDREDMRYGFVDGHAVQATILTPEKCLNEDAQACPCLSTGTAVVSLSVTERTNHGGQHGK